MRLFKPLEAATVSTDEELMASARLDFFRHFGKSDDVECRMDSIGHERVVIVSDARKQAIYSLNVELIKVLNLQGED